MKRRATSAPRGNRRPAPQNTRTPRKREQKQKQSHSPSTPGPDSGEAALAERRERRTTGGGTLVPRRFPRRREAGTPLETRRSAGTLDRKTRKNSRDREIGDLIHHRGGDLHGDSTEREGQRMKWDGRLVDIRRNKALCLDLFQGLGDLENFLKLSESFGALKTLAVQDRPETARLTRSPQWIESTLHTQSGRVSDFFRRRSATPNPRET